MKWSAVLVALFLPACTGAPPRGSVEALSLLGKPLVPPKLEAVQRSKLEANLADAQAAFDKDPSEDNTIWLGRRMAYLGRYNDAIAAFSRGLERYPKSAKLYRHRGHRLITVRKFDDALRDLTQAVILSRDIPDEVEPDGAPNSRNIPRSTLKSNIFYHLGLAQYLKGDFVRAVLAWQEAMKYSRDNDDKLVSTSYWLYLARKRAGDHAAAAAVLRDIRLEMDVIENHGYHRLLLCFKGDLKPEELGEGGDGVENATIAYGLGMRKLLAGDEAGAKADFERIVAPGAAGAWAAFGHIAAEAELARSRDK